LPFELYKLYNSEKENNGDMKINLSYYSCLPSACAAKQQATNDTPQVQSAQNKEP
jgi:hypothetical protein